MTQTDSWPIIKYGSGLPNLTVDVWKEIYLRHKAKLSASECKLILEVMEVANLAIHEYISKAMIQLGVDPEVAMIVKILNEKMADEKV